MKEIREYWDYLLNPNLDQNTLSNITKRRYFLFVFAINIAIVSLIVGVQYGFKHFGFVDVDLFSSLKENNFILLLPMLFLVIILIPIIEEFIFRMHLVPHNKYIKTSIVFGILYFSINMGLLRPSMSVTFFISLLILLVLVVYLIFQRKINAAIKDTWGKKYPTVFYSTAILFGFIHLFNYKLTAQILIFAPILVAPQIFLGINIGYLRVKIGFAWGLLLHILHNVAFFLIPLLIIQGGVDFDINKSLFVIDYPNDQTIHYNYKLNIEVANKKSIFNSCKISSDEIYFEATMMKVIFARLANADTSEVIFENSELGKKMLNLRYNSQKKSSELKQSRHLIIDELLKEFDLKADLYLIPSGYWMLTKQHDVVLSNTLPSHRNDKISNDTTDSCINIKSISIKEVVAKIESIYQIKCVFVGSDYLTYDFSIPTQDTITLQKVLEDEYGIDVNKIRTKTTRFVVRSRNVEKAGR